MISIKINASKIDKTHLYEGKSGKYLDAILIENKDGQPDQYGQDGFVAQSVSKEARARGEKGPIIGSWRRVQQGGQPKPQVQVRTITKPSEQTDDVPF